MDTSSRKLALEQLDRKLRKAWAFGELGVPSRGWLHAVRTTLHMTLRQLAARLDVTPQSVKGFEEREADGSITLRSLRDAAAAMDMKLVYVLVPVDGSLEEMIEIQAERVAESIVLRTAQSMELESQNISKRRLREAIREKKAELIAAMPRYLWD